MKLIKKTAGFVVAVVISLCTSSAIAQDLIFGHVASKTHQNSAALAKGLELGYEIYFKQVNSQGGVRGKTLGLKNLDDEFNADKTIALTRQLAQDPKVVAVGGYVGAGALARIAKEGLLTELRMPMIAPVAGDKSIVSELNFYPFRASFEDETIAMVRHAAQVYLRKRIAIVYLDASFGPFLGGQAEAEAKRLGTPLVAKMGYDIAPAKMEASITANVAKLAQIKPDAVILLAPGKAGISLIKQLREQLGQGLNIYSVSVLQANDVVKALTADVARGIIFAQSVPYPFSGKTRFVQEYLDLMKKHAPSETPSFAGIEGFAGAKILVEAISRAGANPNRESVNSALARLGEFNLGGIYVKYNPNERRGWGSTELTIVSASGTLSR
jgi:branched-chain amino acid transport system substrate-binding protein